MRAAVTFLIILSAIMHSRFIGFNFTQAGIFFVLVIGLLFYLKHTIQTPVLSFLITGYLVFYLAYGALNQNDDYYIFRDFFQLLAMYGYFGYGYVYFKTKPAHKYFEFLYSYSKLSIIFFVVIFTVAWSLKFAGLPIYVQVNLDLIFLVALAIFYKKYIPLTVLFSVLSLKRMFLVSTVSVFFLNFFRLPPLYFLLAFIIVVVGLQIGVLDKYVYTVQLISNNFDGVWFSDPNVVAEFLYSVDKHRGEEVLKILERLNVTSLFFGEGMGGGVIDRSYTTGEMYKVSYAHFLPISLLIKFGIFGCLLPFLALVYVVLSSKYPLKLFQFIMFGFIASIFAAYLITSWAFWLCFGGAIGAALSSKNKIKFGN